MKRGWRRHVERFDHIDWEPGNAARHFAKHGIAFELAEAFDWSDILKRKDVEHRDTPERFNALVRWPAPFGSDVLMFVVYAKVNRVLRLISIRPAEPDEEELYERLR